MWRLRSANCYISVLLNLYFYFGRPHPRPQMGTQLPLPQKEAQLPPFSAHSAHVCCGRMAGWIKMPLCTMVGLSPGNIVLDADPAPHPRGAAPLQNFGHVCCGQTTRWIKMSLGMKAGLGPGHIVLHEDPAPPPKGAQPLIFGPRLLWPNGHPSQLLLSSCLNSFALCHVMF